MVQGSEPARILVIDDSEIVLETVRTTLQEAGFLVETRAQPYGSSWAIVHHRPDVVLVDVNMPGLRGEDIVSVARSRGDLGSTRVLLYSTEPADKLAALARECNADGWIRKTADPRQLIDAVQRWIAPSPAAAAPSPSVAVTSSAAAVLFVDPDDEMRAYYRDVFSGLSQVEFASSGTEALRRLQSDPMPALVVSEVSLPGLNGADLYHRVVQRDATYKERFLFVTGAASHQSWVAQFVNQIDSRVLHKPVSAQRLRDEVEKRLAPPRTVRTVESGH